MRWIRYRELHSTCKQRDRSFLKSRPRHPGSLPAATLHSIEDLPVTPVGKAQQMGAVTRARNIDQITDSTSEIDVHSKGPAGPRQASNRQRVSNVGERRTKNGARSRNDIQRFEIGTPGHLPLAAAVNRQIDSQPLWRRVHPSGQHGVICQIDRRLTCRVGKYISRKAGAICGEIDHRLSGLIENSQECTVARDGGTTINGDVRRAILHLESIPKNCGQIPAAQRNGIRSNHGPPVATIPWFNAVGTNRRGQPVPPFQRKRRYPTNSGLCCWSGRHCSQHRIQLALRRQNRRRLRLDHCR